MAYAITHLAAYPEWQDWIHEELDTVVPAGADLDYEATYPKLKRCLALMVRRPHETDSVRTLPRDMID